MSRAGTTEIPDATASVRKVTQELSRAAPLVKSASPLSVVSLAPAPASSLDFSSFSANDATELRNITNRPRGAERGRKDASRRVPPRRVDRRRGRAPHPPDSSRPLSRGEGAARREESLLRMRVGLQGGEREETNWPFGRPQGSCRHEQLHPGPAAISRPSRGDHRGQPSVERIPSSAQHPVAPGCPEWYQATIVIAVLGAPPFQVRGGRQEQESQVPIVQEGHSGSVRHQSLP